MSEIDFITGQPVEVTRTHNHLLAGTKGTVAAVDRLQGGYNVMLKDQEGTIIGSIPMGFVKALKK